MHTRAVEVYPALVTEAVMDAYTQYLISRAAAHNRSHGGSSQEQASAPQEVPESLEEALAPLEVLYGKTALSAIGIALHGAEPVIRYLEEVHTETEEAEQSDGNVVDGEDTDTADDEEADVHTRMSSSASRKAIAKPHSDFATVARPGVMEDGERHVTATTTTAALSHQAKQRGRCLYHVGAHTLFSPYYCPCSAYAYQSIQRQEVWCCKHLLALQLALRVEATGLPQENLRERVVPTAEFSQLLLRAV